MGLTGGPQKQTPHHQTAFGIIRIRRHWAAIPSEGNLPLTQEEVMLSDLEETPVLQSGEQA